ncbi:MAG TPA: ATP-binding protein [Solimonas sp.]|nr:ATP-binding protein [Solimonas sp.]
MGAVGGNSEGASSGPAPRFSIPMNSLRARLLLGTALLLIAFVSLGGLALEWAFRNSLDHAQQDKLEGLVYSLLGAAATLENGELSIALEAVPDPRLRQPLSGLDAALFNEAGEAVWSSAAFLRLGSLQQPGVGEWRFERLREPDVFSLSFGLRWVDVNPEVTRRYTVTVLEDASAYERQLTVFRRTLWGWLIATLIALMVTLLLLLRWGLAPLRRLGQELKKIEDGEQPQIEGRYPAELQPLTRDLNAMIVAERSQQTRYRNALGDLAHTLKTPLAVLRGLTGESGLPDLARQQLGEQVGRMQHIVDHQLRRAAAAGSRTLTEPVALRPLADKLIAALVKVYATQIRRFDNRIPEALKLRVDQGDLYELLGNLLDNASKYGGGQVRLSAEQRPGACALIVEDNGPGFPEDAERLLQRGVRADLRKPGQGLGLAAVEELVHAYEGRLYLERSSLGGARVVAVLPQR